MKKSVLIMMLLVAVSWGGAVFATVGDSWDLGADFSETQEAGTWSYLNTKWDQAAFPMETGINRTFSPHPN